jgi:hypothetical protein
VEEQEALYNKAIKRMLTARREEKCCRKLFDREKHFSES